MPATLTRTVTTNPSATDFAADPVSQAAHRDVRAAAIRYRRTNLARDFDALQRARRRADEITHAMRFHPSSRP